MQPQDRPAEPTLPDVLDPAPEAGDAPSPATTLRPRAYMWAELVVVLSLAWLPYMLSAVESWRPIYSSQSTRVVDSWLAASMLVASLSVALPVTFIALRSEMNWTTLGLARFHKIWDWPVGLVLAGGDLAAWYAAWYLAEFASPGIVTGLERMSFDVTSLGAWGWAILLASVVANSFAEEIAMRAYLIRRLQSLGVSTTMAVILSAILFASYHVYQGVFSTAMIAGMAVVFAAWFAWTGRLWPLIVAHTLLNIYAFTMA